LGSDAADQDTKKFASQLSAGAKIAIRAVAAVSTFLRQLAGGDPVVRLKAQLNAASDSYPICPETSAMFVRHATTASRVEFSIRPGSASAIHRLIR